MAAAAAIAGLTRWVRPPRPWRPSKLRFEVEAQRWPGSSRSAFMARHIEQPGSRHSKPASRKILSRPSFSASAFTRPEPGTTMAETFAGDLAAARDLGGGAQILDAAVGAGADEHAVDRHVDQPGARRQAHVGERARPGLAACSRPARWPGSGTTSVIGSASCGLVPQVTIGGMSAALRSSSRVEVRARVGRQAPPLAERLVPGAALGRVAAGPRDTRRSSRPARSGRRARPPRSTCCRPSCGLPSSARGSRGRHTRSRSRCRRRCRACR